MQEQWVSIYCSLFLFFHKSYLNKSLLSKIIFNNNDKRVLLSTGVKFYDNDPRYVESAVSSDIGNVSQIVPAMQPEFEIGAVAPHVNHTVGFADVTGSESAQEYTLVVMEALAKTAIELMANPDLMTAVKVEFDMNPLRDPGSYKRKVGE